MSFSRISAMVLMACIMSTPADADPIQAEGFGETASAAITNAAVNAVRDVAGSRITVDQELSSKTFAGVPDELFIEKLLEVSRGTVSRLKVVSVEQVGDLYRANVLVEIDPGKLELKSSGKGALTITPGRLAGGVAEARLKDGAGAQIQAAFDDFASVESKVVVVTKVDIETNEFALNELKRAGLLSEGTIPLHIGVDLSANEAQISELETALKAGAKEVLLNYLPEGNSYGDYRCERSTTNPMVSKSLAIFRSDSQKANTSGYLSCDNVTYQFNSEIVGFPDRIFSFEGKFDATSSLTTSRFKIDLVDQGDAKRSIELEWPINARLPIIDRGVFAVISNYRSQEIGGGFSEWTFSPSALVAQQYTSSPKGWVALEHVGMSFTVPITAAEAEALKSVEVTLARE